MFCKWDNGAIVDGPATMPLGEDWIECVMPGQRTSSAQYMVWNFADGKVVGSWAGSDDPLDGKAERLLITTMRETLEIKPVKAGDYWYDFDMVSRSRFEGTIAAWDDLLAADNGVLFDEAAKIRWRTADNSVALFAKADFSLLYADLIRTAATRASLLYAKSLALKADPNTTIRECAIDQWPIELMP